MLAAATPEAKPRARRPSSAWLLAVALAVSLALLTACGLNRDPLRPASPSPAVTSRAAPSVVVGATRRTETRVVAELYAGALRAEGLRATVRDGLPGRTAAVGALRNGSISVLPDYTGGLLRHFDPGTPATTSDEINRVLPGFVGRELRVLAPARAVVQDVYVVTRKYARENQLSSLDDLSEVSREAVLGGPPSLAERPAGVPGLEEVYGARFRRFRPYDSTAQRVRALNADTIQVAAFLSVNPAIAANGYVRLADPQSMILPQNVVPLVRADVAGNAAAAAALAAVQSALTTDELAGLLARVTGGREAPRKAADDWLRRQGLR